MPPSTGPPGLTNPTAREPRGIRRPGSRGNCAAAGRALHSGHVRRYRLGAPGLAHADRGPAPVLAAAAEPQPLELALEADVSARRVSFLENGRARPSRDMVVRPAGHLEISCRANRLARRRLPPQYVERSSTRPRWPPSTSPSTASSRPRPYPAVILDRHYNLVSANDAVAVLTEDVAPDLVAPPAKRCG